MVTRLSGGLTPANGADPRTFPAIWNATAVDIEAAEADIDSLQLGVNANGTAITALQGSAVALGSAIDVIEAWDLDDLNDVTIGTAVADGQVLAYSSAVSGWVNADAAAGGGAAVSNILYNGAMQVSQRGTSVTSITGGGYFTADRWNSGIVTLGTWTQSVEADGPTGSGFTKSLKMLCTTADASPAAGDLVQFGQLIEGQDLQGLKKGTSDAVSLTLSFWVKSNVTGTYIAYLFDQDNTRSISAAYSISVSGTWEKKTITFAGDTTGAFTNDNNTSLDVRWGLGAGTDYTSGSLQTSWGSLDLTKLLSGQTNVGAATNNYWQITGVQLEVGSTAGSFEHKPYGQELAECQRYYYRSGAKNGGTTNAFAGHGTGQAFDTDSTDIFVPLPVELRAVPTAITFSGIASAVGGTLRNITLIIDAGSSTVVAFIRCDHSSGASANAAALLLNNNNTSGFLALSAEL